MRSAAAPAPTARPCRRVARRSRPREKGAEYGRAKMLASRHRRPPPPRPPPPRPPHRHRGNRARHSTGSSDRGSIAANLTPLTHALERVGAAAPIGAAVAGAASLARAGAITRAAGARLAGAVARARGALGFTRAIAAGVPARSRELAPARSRVVAGAVARGAGALIARVRAIDVALDRARPLALNLLAALFGAAAERLARIGALRPAAVVALLRGLVSVLHALAVRRVVLPLALSAPVALPTAVGGFISSPLPVSSPLAIAGAVTFSASVSLSSSSLDVRSGPFGVPGEVVVTRSR